MYLIAGLGNPEKRYNGTRHNVGFGVIDYLSEKYDIDLSEMKFKGMYGKGRIDGEKVILLKPLTYMNLSGESIRPVADYFKIDTKTELIVLSDDIDLEPGIIRVRPGGSAGGHNGLKNIIALLGHSDFSRVRVGVGKKPPKIDLADWVLGHFDDEDTVYIKEAIEHAADAVTTIMNENVNAAMNKWNGYKPEK
ncbi:MAG: aminoacyl-tRNA hydrolase [Butyrivibrio sp.]|uniref:aminoacyl-tRNA hydrolase n=1 Tax=Butyrivibrio sp. NC2002 TaxID=1410610 RepID=UPI00055C954A|nr:aminoacyl-tRNA hydrolase [Butyrivibrio sp. NC2002]MBE5860397.1 aminoacyl-tRNA hydrolase [Butyrivibrio sp.]